MENIDKEILIKRITELAKDKGISVHTAFVESGAGKNFKSNLATANPSLGKITLIANYLNTTVEYLLGETDIKTPSQLPQGGYHGGTEIKEKPSEQTEDEELVAEFIELLNGLTDEQLKSVFDYIEFIKRKE